MSAAATAAREAAADLWTIEREYQPLPAEPCSCKRPIVEQWTRSWAHCTHCGHDVLGRRATC